MTRAERTARKVARRLQPKTPQSIAKQWALTIWRRQETMSRSDAKWAAELKRKHMERISS